MAHDEAVAFWVEEGREAPGVLEGDQVRLLRVVVEMDGAEGPDLLAGHLRAVDALLQRRGQQRGPHEKQTSVATHVKLGHDAVDDVWLRGEDVDGVHVALGLATVLETLDVGDVGVEDIIFLDDVINQLLGFFVDDEDLPLRGVLVLVRRGAGLGERTSPRVIWRMVLRMTALRVNGSPRLHAHAQTYALAGSRSWTPWWRGSGCQRRQRAACKSGRLGEGR